MATNVVLANGVQPGSTSAETLYTAPTTLTSGTRIIAFTAANPTASPETYSVYIVPSGGSADDTNKILVDNSLAAGDSASPPELQNQLIPKGGTLQVEVSTGTTINFRASGIEF